MNTHAHTHMHTHAHTHTHTHNTRTQTGAAHAHAGEEGGRDAASRLERGRVQGGGDTEHREGGGEEAGRDARSREFCACRHAT